MVKFNPKRLGSSFEDWLAAEGILKDSTNTAIKSVLAWQLSQEMKKKKITNLKMAEEMNTSRTQIDRILDPKAGSVTLETLQRAAKIVGRELRVELV